MLVPPWALACALVAGPVLLGVALGRALRRKSGGSHARRRLLALALALLALALPLLVLPRAPVIGLWDAVSVALLFVLALLGSTLPADPRPAPLGGLVLALGTSLLGLGLVEEYFTRHPPALPSRTPPALALSVPLESRDYRAAPIFPESFGGTGVRHYFNGELPPAEGRRRVLHLGDSMLESSEVPPGTEATALLESLRPGTQHLNFGIANTGPDVYLAMLRRWLPRLRPDEIVVHVFPGNDVTDLDRPYAFCHDGPLLGPAPALLDRCDAPAYDASLSTLARLGPLPLWLRVLVPHSEVAALLYYRLTGWTQGFGLPPPTALAARIARLTAILDAMAELAAASKIPLTVVVLPVRDGREGTDARIGEGGFVWEPGLDRGMVLGAVTASHARSVDVGPAFEAARMAAPARRYFIPLPGNPHLDVDGQRTYASLLARALWPVPERATAPVLGPAPGPPATP